MAHIHHDPSRGGLRPHAVAGTVVGITLLVYAVLLLGQAVGLYIL